MLETKKPTEIDEQLLELIARRGRRLGFRGADLDDAIQEAAIAVLAFEFDEERANGASLETAITTVIDNSIRSFRRKLRRYAKKLDAFLNITNARWTEFDGPVEPNYDEPVGLQLDVKDVLATLSPDEQRICRSLVEGKSVSEIAELLGCDWHTVNRRIARIRERFVEIGLDGWLHAV